MILLSGLLLSISNGTAEAEEVSVIRVGNQSVEEVVVNFGPEGGIDPSLSIPLPSDGPVISSSIKISNVEGVRGPNRVSLDVGMDGKDDWVFGGGKYGGLGYQTTFSKQYPY